MEVRISAVIITFNEERNIGRCLSSLEGVADEIVVVDSYSSDATEAICLAHGARFIRHRFVGHIEQKNWALLQARHPHILSLDADETLSDKLKASILQVKANWKSDAYYFNRMTNYCGKWIRHTTWYPSRKLRLWDSRKGSWGGINPHDRFILFPGSSKEFLKGDILHYSYYSVDEHFAQSNRFSSILAKSYFDLGKRVLLSGLIIRPTWRFFKDYFLRLGILDGYFGLVVSVISSHEVFMKYVKLREMHRARAREKRKVLCCMNSMRSWGGGEKWHFDLASYMKEHGREICYISVPGSPLARRMDELGVRGKQMHISNLSFMNPVRVISLARELKRRQVGVLICNLSVDMKLASAACHLAGVQRIVYRRGSAIPIRNSPLNRFLFRRVLTDIIANSEETRRTIFQNNPYLVPKSKIKLIYNGIRIEPYARCAPLVKAARKELVLGAAGRLSEEKGHVHLLEVLRILLKDEPGIRLLIAGAGPLMPFLKNRAVELGVAAHVEFLGFVEDMPAFFSSLDVFLLSSHYEGFGYVIAEAMASGLPVVAFDIKSSSEIIEHQRTGFVSPLRDIDAFADNVARLCRDEKLRKRMGQAGRERVERCFSFDRSMDQLLSMLDARP